MNLAHNTKMKKLKRDKFDREKERLAREEALHEIDMKVKLMHEYKTLQDKGHTDAEMAKILPALKVVVNNLND